MLARLAICTGLAALVTFGLLYLMQHLITMSGEALEEVDYTKLVEFVRLKRDTQTEEKERKLPEPQRPQEAPPPPEIDLSQNAAPEQQVTNVMPIADTALSLDGVGTAGGAAAADSDAVPLVRVDPNYPPRAQERGIEGWVLVEFTITPAGTVRDPRVIDAYPGSIFNREALRAIRKWKFNPKIDNGEPVERPGVRNKIVFELEGSA